MFDTDILRSARRPYRLSRALRWTADPAYDGAMPRPRSIRSILYSAWLNGSIAVQSKGGTSALPRRVASGGRRGKWSDNRGHKLRVVGACNRHEIIRHAGLVISGNRCAPTLHFLDFRHPLSRVQPLLPQHRRLVARDASGTHRIHAGTGRQRRGHAAGLGKRLGWQRRCVADVDPRRIDLCRRPAPDLN